MMRKGPGHIIRIFFIFLYTVYALVPVHMYAVGGDRSSDRGTSRKHESADIVWANVLFSDSGDDVEAPPSGDGILAKAQQSGDMVLVKKRRALLRDQEDLKPLFQIETLPPSGFERPIISLKSAVQKDPLLRESDGCLTLNSGLSPPFSSFLLS